MSIQTTLPLLIIFSISACTGSNSDKSDAEIVYQFARVDCSSYVESFAENKQKLIDNGIKLYSSQCLLTQDTSMLPICDSVVELIPPHTSGGAVLNFNTNTISEEDLVNLDTSDLDYFLTSNSSGGLSLQSSSSTQDSVDHPGFAGAFSATLPEGVGVVSVLNPTDLLIAYAHEIPAQELAKAESLGFSPANELEGELDFVACE